jgi:hypothetical protein
VRGRCLGSRFRDKEERFTMMEEWPDVPGQRLRLDTDKGTAAVVEPLQADEHAALRSKLTAKAFAIPQALEEFASAHVPTWLYWMKRAVETKLARIVRGQLPDKIDGTPRKQFLHATHVPDPRDRRIDQLLTLLLAKLSPAEKKQFAELLQSE